MTNFSRNKTTKSMKHKKKKSIFSISVDLSKKKKITDRFNIHIILHHTLNLHQLVETIDSEQSETHLPIPVPCQKHVLHPKSSRLHLNPHRRETHSKTGSRGIVERVYRIQHERMLISLFKYRW